MRASAPIAVVIWLLLAVVLLFAVLQALALLFEIVLGPFLPLFGLLVVGAVVYYLAASDWP